MNASVLRLVPFMRAVVPGAATVLLVFVAATRLGIPFLPAVSPFLALGAVYFWGIYYPARIEIWFRPAAGGAPRKLVEKIFRVEGWMA